MSLEANKQLARDYFRAFLGKDVAWFREHIAPTFRRHDPGLPFEVVGPQGVERLADVLLPAFPDMRLDIEDVIAEGDRVVSRNSVTGTHLGEYMGMPPTGKSVTYNEIFIFRVTDGRIAETWGVVDVLSQLRQLGAGAIAEGAS